MSSILRPLGPAGLTLVERDLGEFMVRGAVLVAGAAALVWDTLAEPSDMAPVRAFLAGRNVTVVYSHADWDHCWGTAGLTRETGIDAGGSGPRAAEAGGPASTQVVAQTAAAGRFKDELPATLAAMRRNEPGRWDDVELVPPTRLIRGAETLDIGGVVVELHPLPGHTDDSLVAWIPALGVLLAADVAEDPCPTVGEPAALPGWIADLEHWAANELVRTVVPGHGQVADRDLLLRSARYLEALTRGESVELPTDADAFYRRVHDDNVARARSAVTHRGEGA